MNRIVRKLSLSAGVIALIAMMLPAFASATELQYESEPGEPIPVASSLAAASPYLEIKNFLIAGRVDCWGTLVKLGVTENSGDVGLVGLGAQVAGCERGEINDFAVKYASIVEPGVGTIALSFTWDYGSLECPFEAEGTFSYEADGSTLELDQVPLDGNEICKPSSGQSTLSGSFALSSWGSGEPVLIVDHMPEWSIQSTPSGISGALSDVSCASTTECIAVGEKYEGGAKALAERWDGSEWEEIEGPSGGVLQGVSCTAATSCVAIPNGIDAQRWDGSEWSAIPLSTPAGASKVTLRDVSCRSSSSCMAVGEYKLGGVVHALAERYDGKEWTILTPPMEAGSQLDAVSCAPSVACTMVGRQGGNAVALRWGGGEWSTLPAPEQSGSDISCGSYYLCVIVGEEAAERWNGSSWVSTALPKPEGVLYSKFVAVSCRSAGCMATGFYAYEDEEGLEVPVPSAARWQGGAWVREDGVYPGQAGMLAGVSCTSIGRCTAVGPVGTFGNWTPLAERYE